MITNLLNTKLIEAEVNITPISSCVYIGLFMEYPYEIIFKMSTEYLSHQYCSILLYLTGKSTLTCTLYLNLKKSCELINNEWVTKMYL